MTEPGLGREETDKLGPAQWNRRLHSCRLHTERCIRCHACHDQVPKIRSPAPTSTAAGVPPPALVHKTSVIRTTERHTMAMAMSRPKAMASSSTRHHVTQPQGQSPHHHHRRSPESFQSLSERNHAAEVLQSYEMLSWYSFSRCEVCHSPKHSNCSHSVVQQ